MAKSIEYKVTWTRVGSDKKRTRMYQTLTGAQKWMTLLGPTPWVFNGRNPEDTYCCHRYECDCKGMTVEEHWLKERKELAEIDILKIEQRSVGDWNLLSDTDMEYMHPRPNPKGLSWDTCNECGNRYGAVFDCRKCNGLGWISTPQVTEDGLKTT